MTGLKSSDGLMESSPNPLPSRHAAGGKIISSVSRGDIRENVKLAAAELGQMLINFSPSHLTPHCPEPRVFVFDTEPASLDVQVARSVALRRDFSANMLTYLLCESQPEIPRRAEGVPNDKPCAWFVDYL